MTDPADLALEMLLGATLVERTGMDVDAGERRAAFVLLVRRHAAQAHGLARRLVGEADAEDVVQEAFLKAWRALARFRGEAAPSTWLYRILVNTCRDRARRRPWRGAGGESAANRLDPRAAANPAEAVAGRDLARRVWEAVDELPARQRECLVLRVRTGMSHREIGEVLGIRPGVAKLHVVLARRALLARLGEEVEAWGPVRR